MGSCTRIRWWIPRSNMGNQTSFLEHQIGQTGQWFKYLNSPLRLTSSPRREETDGIWRKCGLNRIRILASVGSAEDPLGCVGQVGLIERDDV